MKSQYSGGPTGGSGPKATNSYYRKDKYGHGTSSSEAIKQGYQSRNDTNGTRSSAYSNSKAKHSTANHTSAARKSTNNYTQNSYTSKSSNMTGKAYATQQNASSSEANLTRESRQWTSQGKYS